MTNLKGQHDEHWSNVPMVVGATLTLEDGVFLALVGDDRLELVRVALVRVRDVVGPLRHRRAELH